MVRIALAFAASCLARLAYWGYKPKPHGHVGPDEHAVTIARGETMLESAHGWTHIGGEFDPTRAGWVAHYDNSERLLWFQQFPGGWQ